MTVLDVHRNSTPPWSHKGRANRSFGQSTGQLEARVRDAGYAAKWIGLKNPPLHASYLGHPCNINETVVF